MDKLPPTKYALLQHIRWAVYQAGIWTASRQAQQVVSSAQDFAWNKLSESWAPIWVTILEVSDHACNVEVLLQRKLLQLQMWKSKSGLLSTFQMQLYQIEQSNCV